MEDRIPPYLRQRLEAQYGPLAEEILAGFAEPRPVTLRANTLKTGRPAVEAALAAAGIAFEEVPWYADALVLPQATEAEVRALPLYAAGEVYLQGLSAMLPPLLMDLTPGSTVLDMAAAPGGKTTQMAALSGGQVLLTACEQDATRADRLKFNLERQGVRRAQVLRTDARHLDELFRFDSILLDAPCTGSGTVLLTEPPRRMEPGWVARVVKTQQALLKKALTLLKRGGTMVYSTCSILAEENEGVLQAVLPGFQAEIVPITADWADALPKLPVSLPGTLCVKPTRLYEGFFVAVVRKG